MKNYIPIYIYIFKISIISIWHCICIGINNMASLVLDQYLRCPVCMDFFADPHRLPCSHCFCKRCLEGVRQHCLSFNCPECRQLVILDYKGVDGLEKDRRLAAMVDEFAHQQQQSRVCKEHKRTVEGYCETCAVLMCGRCFFSDQHSGHVMGDVDVVAKRKRVLERIIILKIKPK